MELEQAKLEELEGDDSRIVDEEEFGENEENGIDSAVRRRGYPFGDESKDGNNDDGNDVIGRATGQNSSNHAGTDQVEILSDYFLLHFVAVCLSVKG
jgi:hypothetical protein